MAGKKDDPNNLRETLWPVTKLINAVFLSLVALALSIAMIGAYLWRFAPPATHQSHLDQMMAFYVDNAIASDRADAFGKGAYHLVLVETGLERLQQRKNTSGFEKPQKWRNLLGLGTDLWSIVSKSVYIFGAKISSLVSALPLLALLLFVAITDGAAARYIRREEGGNESATRYHLWKKISHSWIPIIMALAYLTCPIAVEPLWFILPTALVLGVGVRSQVKYFKKYL